MFRNLLVSTSALIVAMPALAQSAGGLNAQCQIMGQPVQLDLQYEVIGGAGATYGPGANPDITGVIGDGSSTIYWQGMFTAGPGQQLPVSGENRFLRFYDANVLNRETVLEVTQTGETSFYLTDVYGNYPGQHPCEITNLW